MGLQWYRLQGRTGPKGPVNPLWKKKFGVRVSEAERGAWRPPSPKSQLPYTPDFTYPIPEKPLTLYLPYTQLRQNEPGQSMLYIIRCAEESSFQQAIACLGGMQAGRGIQV